MPDVIIRILIFLVLLPVWCAPSAWSGESVTLTNGEWPPYHSQAMPGGGVGSMIYREAFALAGIEVEYEFLPWKRAYEKAKHGGAQGSVSWLKRPEREKHFRYSDPVMDSRTVFFYNQKSGFDWQDFEDLKDMRIGTAVGQISPGKLQEAVLKGSGKIEVVRSYEQGMRLLIAGRLDTFYCNQHVGNHLLKTTFRGETDILPHPKPLQKGDNYLIISRKVPDGQRFIERFNRGLQLLRESGRYDEIFDMYFIPDYGL